MKQVGILSGTFDPIHRGHVNVARNAVACGAVDEVWLLVSPENPFKSGNRISPAADRVEMAKILVSDMGADDVVKVSDFELSLPVPTYTITTLTALRELYPDISFRLIIGADNVAAFGRWKESERIAREFGLIVYPRPGYTSDNPPAGSVILDEVPEDGVSATMLRSLAARGEEGLRQFADLTSPALAEYVKSRGLYLDDQQKMQ